MPHTEESFVYENIEVSGLTPRRREALALRACGLSYKRCAQIMGCSADNVKNRIDDLYFEFRASSTPQLMTKAIQKGVLRILTLLLAMHLGLASPINNHALRTARIYRQIPSRAMRYEKC